MWNVTPAAEWYLVYPLALVIVGAVMWTVGFLRDLTPGARRERAAYLRAAELIEPTRCHCQLCRLERTALAAELRRLAQRDDGTNRS